MNNLQPIWENILVKKQKETSSTLVLSEDSSDNSNKWEVLWVWQWKVSKKWYRLPIDIKTWDIVYFTWNPVEKITTDEEEEYYFFTPTSITAIETESEIPCANQEFVLIRLPKQIKTDWGLLVPATNQEFDNEIISAEVIAVWYNIPNSYWERNLIDVDVWNKVYFYNTIKHYVKDEDEYNEIRAIRSGAIKSKE